MKTITILQKIIVLSLITCCIISFVSCKKQKESDKELFLWTPVITAPELYPTGLYEAFIFYGGGNKKVIPGEYLLSDGTEDFFQNTKKNALPTGASIAWLSFYDKKFYNGRVDFPYNKLLNLFQKPYSENQSYNEINIRLLPSGKALLYAGGEDRCVLFDTVFQAYEANMPVQRFQAHNMSTEESVSILLDAENKALGNNTADKSTFSDVLLRQYMKRYNYDIVIEFEDEQQSDLAQIKYEFVNDEYYSSEQYFPISPKAVINTLRATWLAEGIQYRADFYFDEQEIMKIFSDIYKDDLQEEGILLIKIAGDYNSFNISLNIAGQTIRIENTELDVFKISSEEVALLYRNYRVRKNILSKIM